MKFKQGERILHRLSGKFFIALLSCAARFQAECDDLAGSLNLLDEASMLALNFFEHPRKLWATSANIGLMQRFSGIKSLPSGSATGQCRKPGECLADRRK